jgi:phosphotransferase system  glucose/maltose/N-acetylglucosamine-specific IIC component/phosphotransferase system IIB component
MRRWNALVEMAYFPLEIIYIASIVLGLAGLVFNPNFQVYINLNQTILLRVLDMARYLSSLIILYFPLIFILRAVYHRKDDGLVIIAGFLAYISFHIGMMFFGPNIAIPEAYFNLMGLQANAAVLGTVSTGTLQVFNTGLFSAMLIVPITRGMVATSKRRSPYGLFNYVNKTVYVVLGSVFLSLIVGLAMGFIWPIFVGFIQQTFRIIAQDLNNPTNLFMYGLLNRMLNVVGLGNWMNQVFWFSELGGTWTGPNGTVYFGDISMWVAQHSRNITGFTSGKLITPLYILNIFSIPAFILASYQTYTEKFIRRRLVSFVIIAVLASVWLGTLLPVELFMMFTAPLVFVFHLIYTALLYAVLPILGITIGYRFDLAAQVATPGSIIDLLVLIRNPAYQRSLIILAFVGLITFLIYYAFISFYYRKGAISMVLPYEKDLIMVELVESMGGLKNIKAINASVNKVIVQVKERDLVDFNKLHHRASKIVESRAGYAITYGASSYIIYLSISEQLKETSPSKKS